VSIRALAAAAGLSSSRVHQIVAAADLDELDAQLGELRSAGWPAPEDPDSDDDAELDGRDSIADRLSDEVSWLQQCADWLAHLDADSYPPAVNLRPAADWPDRALVTVDLARVRAVIDRIAADVDELARARRAGDLDTAAVLPGRRAERRRRLAEPDLEFRAFCTRRRLPASSTPQLERAWDAWQAERYQRGEISQRPGYADNPFRPPHATAHTRAVQETGRRSGADGSIVTGTPTRSSISTRSTHCAQTANTCPWFCLSRTSFGVPRPERLRPRVGKVAVMRHRRYVLGVLSLIDQSTVNFSVFDTSASPPANPKWSRQASVTARPAATRSRGGSPLRTNFGILHRRMRRHRRDALLITF
jgi:hypothetical protein